MEQVLSKIKPDKEEQKKFKSITSEFVKKIKIKDAKAVLGGSGAKNTWLSGNHDVDIFVLFDYQKFAQKSGELSNILEKALKKSFKFVNKLHGSRDYFQIQFKELDFEVVPILKISKANKAINITDISPLHSKWVNKNARYLKDDIRLVKQFCKANGLYGAESYINGFSGYVLEILTAYYGSFAKLLRASSKWGMKDIVDPSKFYQKKTALFHMNKSKLQSPIIVVDPVDKTRNAAAALSKEKWLEFKRLAAKYLKSPHEKFFEKEDVSLEKLKKTKDNLVFLTLTPLKGKDDVVGAKLWKVYKLLERELTKFSVKKSSWDWNRKGNAVMYFILAKKELPKFEEHIGPPVGFKDFVKKFKKKNRNTFVKDGRLMAKLKVKHPKLKDSVSELLKDEYVKEKIKKIEVEF